MADLSPPMDYARFPALAPDAYAGMLALGKAVDATGLDKRLTELVKLRVSQINGCAFCLAFHMTIIRKAGIEPAKLDRLSAWRDTGLFSDRERAALAWAERLTLLADDPPPKDAPEDAPEDAYDTLRIQFSEPEAIALTVAVAAINAWNRISVGLRFTPPVQFEGHA